MPSSHQDWSPETYLRNAAFVPELGKGVLDLLNPQPGERILDIGCGEGLLSAKIQAAGAHVYAIDLSPHQVQGTRARGVDAHVMDGHDLDFENEFDAVFSNAALHWMRPISKVFDNIYKALKPGGRFIAEMGGAGNIASIRTALYAALEQRGVNPSRHDPWSFPGPGEAKYLLKQAGFQVKSLDIFGRPTQLPGDIGDWLDTFASSFLFSLDASLHDEVLNEVREALRPELMDKTNTWVADYVRLKFEVVKL